jgi:MFS transporter, ACS family, pantothenate transporter
MVLTLVMQIDTSNITNAFVSGMKEDLNLYKNQYNYIIVSWTVGYIIGQWVNHLHWPPRNPLLIRTAV